MSYAVRRNDGYWLVINPDTGILRWSEREDEATTWTYRDAAHWHGQSFDCTVVNVGTIQRGDY